MTEEYLFDVLAGRGGRIVQKPREEGQLRMSVCPAILSNEVARR